MPSLFKRMTRLENKLMILCFSKCFHLCRYNRIVKVQALMQSSVWRIHFIHKLFKKDKVWPKQMLIIPSDIQVYACTTFLGYMLKMSTLNYHNVWYETRRNMVALIKIVMVVWKLIVWNGSEHNTSAFAWRNWWTW
jgi:hypothetical protein